MEQINKHKYQTVDKYNIRIAHRIKSSLRRTSEHKHTGCSEKKYDAQNRYSIQTTNDREMKQRPIDS